MVHSLRILIAVVATVLAVPVMVASPAQAEESDYLSPLQDKYVYLTSEQLLTEGYKVCQAVDSGMVGMDTITMVREDLAVPVPVAYDIFSTAVVQLGC